MKDTPADLTVLNLGAGVQSSTLALLAEVGAVTPKPDLAIFADTQWEPAEVYKHLDWLKGQLSFPVHVVTAGDIRANFMTGTTLQGFKGFVAAPTFLKSGGLSRRQCTRDYKIRPIIKEIRRLLGVGYRQRVPKGTTVEQWFGISTDEIVRAKPPREAWSRGRWPLIELDMSRRDCLRWFAERYPGRTLAKSSCIGCPFHDNALWRHIRDNAPEEWQDAIHVDKVMREQADPNAYLHRQRIPLSEAKIDVPEDNRIPLFDMECEGMCGVRLRTCLFFWGVGFREVVHDDPRAEGSRPDSGGSNTRGKGSLRSLQKPMQSPRLYQAYGSQGALHGALQA